MTGKSILAAGLIGVLSVVSACSPIYRNHGYVPTEDDLAEIVVGVDSRETVADVIGAPSSTGVLRDSGYFYVRSRIKASGPRRPEVVERQVLAISFDPGGVVQNIERFGLQDGRVVILSRRVTEGGVTDKTFLRQLLGNFGRFDPADALSNR